MFGFTTPALLFLGIPIAALLVYAYLRKGRGEQLVVATTLFLRALTHKATSRKQFLPPFRFFFELLLFALLLLALSGVFKNAKGTRVAFLIDNSYSMRAKTIGGTRISEAKRIALAELTSLPLLSTVSVYTTGKSGFLELADVGREQAEERLSKIESYYASDQLETALDHILTDGGYERIIVVSDRPIQNLDRKDSSGVIRFHQVETALALQRVNTSIIDLALTNDENGRSSELMVTVAAFANEEISATLSVEQVGNAKFREKRQIKIGANKRESIKFSNLPQGVAFEVNLLNEKGGDALSDDNYAWAAPGASNKKILLVSPYRLADLKLNRIRSFDWLELSLPEFLKLKLESNDAAAILFHHVAPPDLPSINSLFILPDNTFESVKTNSTELSSWDRESPILSYLNLPALKLKHSRKLTVPVWGKSLIDTTEGSILFAGDHKGAHLVVSGIELLPYEGEASRSISILTLNILKWLAPFNTSNGYIKIGSAITLSKKTRSLSLKGVTLTPSSLPHTFSPQKPGIYELIEEAAPRYLAVNFFDAVESNILTAPAVILPTLSAVEEKNGEADYNLIELLLLIATAMLMLDLAVLIFKPFRRFKWRSA